MTNKDKNKIYYKALNMWYEVSEEVYKTHCREVDAFKSRMKYQGKCYCPRDKWWYCDMICSECKYQNANSIMDSLDRNFLESSNSYLDLIAVSDTDVEKEVQKEVLIEKFFEEIDKLSTRDKKIISLMLEGYSERQIALEVETPRSTYKRNTSVLLNKISKNLKKFN